MNQSNIVQKLLPASFDAQVNWNSACLLPAYPSGAGKSVGADKYCNGPGLGRSLARFTPCQEPEAAEALAAVHAELILIHPFRDGNGRLARLLALLMGLQAGLPPLDFSPLDGRGKMRYIAAIHAAMGRDYRPLAAVFERIIERTRKRAASSR